MAIRLTPRLKYPFPDFLPYDGRILSMYASGHTSRDIGREVGVSHRTVLNRLRRHAVVRRGRWDKQLPTVDALKRMYRDGSGTVELGRKFGYTATRIGQILRTNGVKVVHRKRFTSEQMAGAKNTNWHGGASFLPYGPEFTKELKERIRERDGRACQLCGMTEAQHRKLYPKANGAPGGQKNPVHHVNYDKKDCSEGNLITLCHDCNAKVNFGRGHWQTLLQAKLGVLL